MESRILIIEDEEDIRECLRDFFEYEGYSVITAANGQEALSLSGSIAKPDLILVDLMMPIMNGAEFIAKCKATDCFSEVPVVVMSAHNLLDSKVSGLGIKKWIRKPMELEDLLSIARSCKS